MAAKSSTSLMSRRKQKILISQNWPQNITGLRAFSKALLKPDEQILCIEAEEEEWKIKESHKKRKPLSSGP
jgi:hypothetical protein